MISSWRWHAANNVIILARIQSAVALLVFASCLHIQETPSCTCMAAAVQPEPSSSQQEGQNDVDRLSTIFAPTRDGLYVLPTGSQSSNKASLKSSDEMETVSNKAQEEEALSHYDFHRHGGYDYRNRRTVAIIIISCILALALIVTISIILFCLCSQKPSGGRVISETPLRMPAQPTRVVMVQHQPATVLLVHPVQPAPPSSQQYSPMSQQQPQSQQEA